jgi:hypothetical protein
VMPPHKVLHTELVDASKLKAAMTADKKDRPYVVVVPKDFSDPGKAKKLLIDSGLWFLT